ncbi:hypothetical protein TRIATDRAFT_309987 [Trichoderma atroviride IMI 206040]|uniref:Uncharacterized protein n=1 Tax=Hypocrea atroviridis (strain ATCC 20476 / IMI 206040) TaxID=452589 RepID=G9P0S7_HYPAI|nr:uncharacterized protein TRIATDRAFT_309987 [Trichoderma atroviride IMI 206040]EHK42394.1 hypothetical protein TRIATDRAFT_309987 [Trichoderma atroviride IMI 206040]
MSLPKAPIKSREQTLQWMSTAPEDIRDPEFLWGECWQRFNTIQMPIASTTEYFDIAIQLATMSNDKSSFEKLFQRALRRRQAEVTKWFADFKRNAWRDGQSFPCGSARVIAVEFCRTGSLNSLLQLLDGVAYGWKDDKYAVNGAPIEPLSDDGSEIPQTQFWDEEDLWYGDMAPSGTPDAPCAGDRVASEAPSQDSTIQGSDSWHQKPPSSSQTAEEHLRHLSQHNADAKCEQHGENENPSRKRMRFDDAAQQNDESDDDNLFPSHQPTASTQRVDGYSPKKRRRLDEDGTRETKSPMVSDRAASSRQIGKRARANDDCNDGHGLKRQKIERRTSTTSGLTASASLSDDTPTNNEKESLTIEPEQAVVDDMPRKNPQTDSDNNDNEKRPRQQAQTSKTDHFFFKSRTLPPDQHIEYQIYEEDWIIYALGTR